MPFRVGPAELVLILILVLLLFGIGRLARLGSELGKGLRAFREGIAGGAESTNEAVHPGSGPDLPPA